MVRSAAMRDTRPLDPMWDPEPEPGPARGGAFVQGAARVLGAVAPALVTWVRGMRPQVRVAWGATEYHLQRDGVVATRRDGPGFEDNPRSNYNERVAKRQAKSPPPASPPVAEAPAQPEPAPDPAPAAAARLDFSEAALRKGVDQTMGKDDSEADLTTDPEALKAELARVRASLQALDDVKDWGAVAVLDDELYKLHKAVEYKMRNHKASEAKSKLDDLFK